MGATLTKDYLKDYEKFSKCLDTLDSASVQEVYEKLIKIDDYDKLEVISKLICHKAAASPILAQKYAQLTKELENERNRYEDENFSKIFAKVFDDFIKNSVSEAGQLDDERRKNIAMQITNFFGHLFNVGVIEKSAFGKFYNFFNAKNHDDRFHTYLEHLTSMTQETMNKLGIYDPGEIYDEEDDSDEEEIPELPETPIVPTKKLVKAESLDYVKDFDSFCNHIDYRSNIQKNIIHDEQMFSPKLIVSINVRTEEEVTQICERFVDRAIVYESYLPIFGQIALRINSALQSSNLPKEISFKNILIDTIIKRFENVPSDEEAELEKRMVIALYGEMYNINWIKQKALDIFMNALKSLKNDHFYIILLQSLLQICGMKLALQSSKEHLIELREEVKKIARREEKDGHLRYMVQDVLQNLNFIVGIREQSEPQLIEVEREKEDENGLLTVENLFKDMCEEAYLDVINDVKSKPIDNIEEFIEKLITKALSSCAQMVAKATRDIATTTYMREALANKLHSTFLDYIKDENKCGSTIRLLHYIGELYNLDVLTNDFLNVCFDILFDQSGEISTVGTSALLRCVGAKMEMANKSKIESYFQFFDHIVMKEHSRRSREFKKLKALRANDWNEHGIQHSYEDFLMLYTIDNAEIEEVVMKFHSNHVEIEKFINCLWKTILNDPHPSYSELCRKLSKFVPEFKHALTEFLKSRCNTFANLESQHYNESVNCRLGKVLVFVSELYQMDVIAEHLFEIWIDPRLASKVPHCFILTIISLITSKVDASNNSRLKTLVANLEHINEDKSQQRWNSICGDMNELKEAMKKYKIPKK